MDHGQFEMEGRVISQVQVGGVDHLCDNLPNPEALTAQTQNLNETNTLTQTRSASPLQHEEGGRCGPIQKTCLNNNGKEEEVGQGKEGYTGRNREEEEEEDIDEAMKEEDEEEESEESSCLNRCQSPDTPMTDSSYSETGSLLETPYPFSPGTSPEPTSPVIPAVSPETVYPISSVELIQSHAETDTRMSSSGSGASTTESITCTRGPAFTTGPMDCTSRTITSATDPACVTEATESIAKNTNSTTEQLTSEPVLNCGPDGTRGSAGSHAGPNTTAAETFTLTALARLNTSTNSTPVTASQQPLNFTIGLTTTGTDSTFTTGPISSNQEHITSTPVTTCFSVSACATGPIPSPALLGSLEQLAQRGDDIQLPQSLHQIAEAFVLHGDYQRALWCIQLERLYHQRVLDNLNALQQQWEIRFRRRPSDLAAQYLDSLKRICQTHNRPRTRDAECASLNFVSPKFDEGGALPSCTSAHQVEGGMEQRAEDSFCSVMPSINLPDGLNSPEMSGMDREDLARESEGRNGFHGSQLTDEQGNDGEGGEAGGGVGCTISVIGNGLHPSTAGGMDLSKPAEQQGQDLGPAQETEAKEEEEGDNVEEATEALEMEDEGEEEEGEEKKEERDSLLSQKTLPVEAVCSGAEVELQQLHQDAQAQEKLHGETQESTKTSLHQEVPLPHEAYTNQQEPHTEVMEKDEEEDYDVDQADIIREAPSLDEMAKLITVEELSPASGLVSILKKRNVCVDNVSASSGSEPRPEKPIAKRRVHFKVPDDHYEPDAGSGDSCLLLFLLCLVTVFISVGGTALYCALGDAQSSVCQDFSRNADFYINQIQRGIAQIQHWFTPGS